MPVDTKSLPILSLLKSLTFKHPILNVKQVLTEKTLLQIFRIQQ